MKRGSLIKSHLSDYIRKYAGGQKFQISKARKVNSHFSKFFITFDQNSDISLIENNFGFRGNYYSIPFSSIDVSLGSLSKVSEKLYQMYNVVCRRVIKEMKKRTNEQESFSLVNCPSTISIEN